jgi:Rrf2 family protein
MSRTQTLTDAIETSTCSAIGLIGQPARRNARAAVRSATFARISNICSLTVRTESAGREAVESSPMRVSAKADYAVRAMVELAASAPSDEHPAKGEAIAGAQAIPPRFLENILGELRVHGLVHSRRGADGGYWLAREADETTLADIIRAVEGPLATVRGEGAEDVEYRGASKPLEQVWLALRANIRQVLETVTLADVVANELPEPVLGLAEHPEAAHGRDSRFVPRIEPSP